MRKQKVDFDFTGSFAGSESSPDSPSTLRSRFLPVA